jgi:hypothetical protein
MQRGGNGAARVANGLLLAALLAAYPLALVRPVHTGTSLVFFLILPVFFWLSLLCLAWLLTTPVGRWHPAAGSDGIVPGYWLPCVVLALAAWVAGNAFIHPGATLFDTVLALGAFVVPVWFAVAPRACLPRRLPLMLAVVWGASAVHGLWQLQVGFQVVGLTGNRNWMAALILALTPWVWLALAPRRSLPAVSLGENLLRKGYSPNPFPNLFGKHIAEFAGRGSARDIPDVTSACLRIPQSAQKVSAGGLGENPFQRGSPNRGWPRVVRLLAGAVVLVVSLGLASRAESRGAWLALGGYLLLFWVLPRFSWPGRGLLVGGLAGVAVACVMTWPERVAQAIEDDIRLPLWAQTARLAAAQPWGGCGPGLFRREFVQYKSAAQMERRVAAAVTEHPHNEPLQVAATLGVPLAVLWLAQWWPLTRRPRGALLACAHFTAWMIFCTALLDKTLTQPPTQIAGYLCLGLLWRARWPGRLRPARRSRLMRATWLAAAGVALVIGLVVGVPRVLASAWFRSAAIAEEAQRYPEAVAGYARAARLCPEDPTSAMLAGTLANSRLRNPQQALAFLQAVWSREPDFAHVNGEIGFALGLLGKSDAALPFLERDTRLYPFDGLAWQRYLMCCLLNQRWEAATAASDRLAELWDRKLRNQLGDAEVKLRCGAFVLALQEGRLGDAQVAAQVLLGTLDAEWADPGLGDLPGGVDAARRLVPLRFGPADARLWRQAWTDRQAVLRGAASGGDHPGVIRRGGYPVHPLEFCGRTLVLAGLLKSEFGVRAPLLAEPPTLRLARCRAAAAAAGETAPVGFVAE